MYFVINTALLVQSMSDADVSLLTDVLGDSAITTLDSDSWEKKRHLVNQAERILFEAKKIQDPVNKSIRMTYSDRKSNHAFHATKSHSFNVLKKM